MRDRFARVCARVEVLQGTPPSTMKEVLYCFLSRSLSILLLRLLLMDRRKTTYRQNSIVVIFALYLLLIVAFALDCILCHCIELIVIPITLAPGTPC